MVGSLQLPLSPTSGMEIPVLPVPGSREALGRRAGCWEHGLQQPRKAEQIGLIFISQGQTNYTRQKAKLHNRVSTSPSPCYSGLFVRLALAGLLLIPSPVPDGELAVSAQGQRVPMASLSTARGHGPSAPSEVREGLQPFSDVNSLFLGCC